MKQARAFAPATVANVAVGFDILGFSVDGVGDTVTVTRREDARDVLIESVTGAHALPFEPDKNTATVGLKKMIADLRLDHGFTVRIEKGIPLASGMGGSAACAVAAVVAASAILKNPLPQEDLLSYALAGEAVASGAAHADNVGPCLNGGLTLALPTQPPKLVSVPVPSDIFCTLVHPDLLIETRAARALLRKSVTLAEHAEQSAWLAGFLSGCAQNDHDLIRLSMRDILIEPQRSQLIPGFAELQAGARKLGALGFSISGSGPSVFAWSIGRPAALELQAELISIFSKQGISAQGWVSPVQCKGARIVS